MKFGTLTNDKRITFKVVIAENAFEGTISPPRSANEVNYKNVKKIFVKYIVLKHTSTKTTVAGATILTISLNPFNR
jgi:hypothetical protein